VAPLLIAHHAAWALCQCPDTCYALKAEVQYPAPLPYRRRQAQIILDVSPEEFASHVRRMYKLARNKPTVFRFNESGDFRTQNDVEWFATVAGLINDLMHVYGYTARTDLNLDALMASASVNVSNDGGGMASERRESLSCRSGVFWRHAQVRRRLYEMPHVFDGQRPED